MSFIENVDINYDTGIAGGEKTVPRASLIWAMSCSEIVLRSLRYILLCLVITVRYRSENPLKLYHMSHK